MPRQRNKNAPHPGSAARNILRTVRARFLHGVLSKAVREKKGKNSEEMKEKDGAV
jgi:hypothetical protein